MEDIEKLEIQLIALQWEARWCQERLMVLELVGRDMKAKIEQVKVESTKRNNDDGTLDLPAP